MDQLRHKTIHLSGFIWKSENTTVVNVYKRRTALSINKILYVCKHNWFVSKYRDTSFNDR